MLRKLWHDEVGLVISAELVLVLTIGVLMLVVGLHAVTKAVNYELGDIASAIGALDQSYSYDGFEKPSGKYGCHAFVAGSAYGDKADECDCAEIIEVRPRPKKDGSSSGRAEND